MVGVPFWMIGIVAGKACSTCGRPMTLDDITGVAVRLGGNGDDKVRPMVGPITYVLTQCRCGASQSRLATVDAKTAKTGVTCIFDLAAEKLKEANANAKSDLPKRDEKTCDGKCDGNEQRQTPTPPRPPKRPPRRSPPVSPSNDGCPKTPLRDPEVQLFIRQLKRMSFNRHSKSFALIMRKLGFDTDGEPIAPPPPPPPEEDDDAPPF